MSGGNVPIVVSNNRLLRALPMRGIRAHVGTKSGRTGGATALIDLEPAGEFEAVDAVPEAIWIRWKAHDDPDLVPMCFDNIVIGIQEELRALLGPELPALRVVVHEVLPHPVEANEMKNRIVGKKVIREAFKRLATPHTLVSAEVDLAYDVHGPLPTVDGRPPLFMIGHPMTADGFATLSAIFIDRTVVTYDPRGLGRSVRGDGRVDHRPDTQAQDIHALIQALDAGPVDMFASSGGAVTALALVAAHPGDARTLVAYEPPLIPVLPDTAAALRARAAVRAVYEAEGFGPAMAACIGMTLWQGEFTDDYFAWPGLDPRKLGMPPRDDGKRDDPLLSDRSWAVSGHDPDIEALTAASTRVVIAVSGDSRDTMAGRAAIAAARLLGQEATVLPNQPEEVLGFWFDYEGDPAAFANKLRSVLD
jgi:pimeloyl-ACP methyl ester carboxylesterase